MRLTGWWRERPRRLLRGSTLLGESARHCSRSSTGSSPCVGPSRPKGTPAIHMLAQPRTGAQSTMLFLRSRPRFQVRIVLRSLPAFVHTVVAYVTDATMAQFSDAGEAVWRPPCGVIARFPGREEQHLSGIVDTLEQIVVDQSLGLYVEAEVARQPIWIAQVRVRCRRDFGNREGLGFADFGRVKALLDHLQALGRLTVGGYFANTQMIVIEDAVA